MVVCQRVEERVVVVVGEKAVAQGASDLEVKVALGPRSAVFRPHERIWLGGACVPPLGELSRGDSPVDLAGGVTGTDVVQGASVRAGPDAGASTRARRSMSLIVC